MPKLKWDDSCGEKRKQIADMKERNIITTAGFISKIDRKQYDGDADPLKWSDADVQDFYENYVSPEEVAEYEAIVDAENSLLEAEKNKASDYQKNRPVKDAAFQKKINDLYKEHLSVEEREEKINEIEEELEYAQLKYDKGIGKLTKPEAIARYAELDKKYNVKEYEQMTVRTNRLEKYLENVNKRLEKLGIPEKPGFFTRMWNKIQHISSGEYLKSVSDYEEYTRLSARQTALQKSVDAAKIIQDAYMEEHPLFDYENITKKVEVSPLELAKHIVKMSMSKTGVALSAADIANQAKVVMETEQFKAVKEEFGDKLKYVDPNAFYKRFMAEMAPKTEEAEHSKDLEEKAAKSEMQVQNPAKRMQ